MKTLTSKVHSLLILPNVNSLPEQMSSQGTLTGLMPTPPIGSGTHREFVRHILLGSPEAVQQTIHLLHTLHYTETVMWSPVLTVAEPLVITPAQSEAMSLLRKMV